MGVRASVALLAATAASPVWGTTYAYIDTANNGLWSTPGSWSPSGPPSQTYFAADVILGTQPASVGSLNVTFNLNMPVNNAYDSVTLNSSGLSSYMIVNQTGANTQLVAGNETIGTTTSLNEYNQSAGTNNVINNLNIGNNSAGNYYYLSGSSSVLQTTNMNIGVSGVGTLTQTGGTVYAYLGNSGETILGVNNGANGYYTQSGGSFTGEILEVGEAGFGDYVQSAGTTSITDNTNGMLLLGAASGGSGIYSLSGSGVLSADQMTVGDGGTGTFTMSGGTATLYYPLSVGQTGSGTFNFMGGTFNGSITVGGSAAGTGVVNLSAPISASMTVGAYGTTNLLTGGVYNGHLIINGGTFNMSGGTFGQAGLELDSGTLNLNGYSPTFYSLSGTGGTITTVGNSTITINGASGTYSGTLSNGGGVISLIISGTSTNQAFSGIGSYTGTTLIETGATLYSAATYALSASSPVTINSGGNLQIAGGTTATVPSISGNGGIITVTGASLSTGGVGAGYSTTFNGSFVGNSTSAITKTGYGTFTLGGSSSGTFSGTFNVSQGALQNGAVNGIPIASTVSLYYGTTLVLNYTQTLAEVNGILATINFSNGSILTVGGDNGSSTYEGYLNGSGTFVKAGTGTFTLGTGVNDLVAPNTDAALGFNVSAGTLLLNKGDGYNAIGGPVLVSGGILLQGISDQIADTSVVTLTAGAYNLAGFNETIGGLAGTGGNVALGGGNLTINQAGNSAYSGSIGGLGSIVKNGAGSLNLSSASAFSGSFTVNAGQLTLMGPVNATGLAANSGATLEFLNSSLTLNNGTIQSNTGGTVEYSNSNISNGYLLGGGSHTILANGTTTFNFITTFNSTVVNQNGPGVFSFFTNGGTLNNAASLTLEQSTNNTSGIFNISGAVSTLDFTSDGVINILSGGVLTNTGGNLYFGGGSRTYVNSGGNLSTGTSANIQLNGALLTNNGVVNGIVNVNFDSLATGTGTYLSAVNVNPGGTYAPGVYGAQSVLANPSSTIAAIQPAAGGVTNTSTGVVVGADTVITVNGTDTLVLAGSFIASGYTVQKVGTGTVILAPFTAVSLDVAQGKMQLSVSRPETVLGVQTLSVESGATLDIGNNGLDISGGSLSAITALVASGYANGTWTGTGIDSSSCASDSTHLTAIGVIQNNQSGASLFSPTKQFDGTVPGLGDILVKDTWYGDTNLDGKVDGTDYGRIDAAYFADRSNPALYTGWYNGDFNYDGKINGSDYTLMDNSFNRQGAPLTAAIATAQIAGTAVPEPTTITLIAISGIGLLGRNRRHHIRPPASPDRRGAGR